jgi:alkylhydroperoxidase/carboxymuconolactone decarboxylase family protein YurZ
MRSPRCTRRPQRTISPSSGCETQLRGHVAANLRVGNDRARLLDTLIQLVPFIGYPRTLNALRVLDEVAPAAALEDHA